MHFLNFKTNQVYHIVFQVFGILKDEDKLKRKLILVEIFMLYKRMVKFCAYTFCQKKKTLSARPYIESVFFCYSGRTHGHKTQRFNADVNMWTIDKREVGNTVC